MNNINIFKNIFMKVQKAAGSSAGIEIYAGKTNDTTITWSEGKLEDFYISELQGIGLRIIKDGKVGFSYSNNFNEYAINDLISSAEKNSEFLPADKYVSLARSSKGNPELDVKDEYFGKGKTEQKISILKNMEQSALSNKKIKSVIKIGYSESLGEVFIINSNGLEISSAGTVFSYGISCVAYDKGETQVGGESTVKRIYNQLNFEKTTSEAVKNSVDLLGAKRIKTGNYPVIFNQNVGCEFLGLLESSFSAFAVQKNISLLKGKLNQKVCSAKVNIIDDGTLKDGIATSSYDDEGTPTQKTIIIENGILKNYIYDIYTANKDNTKSTGNASRGYSGNPVPDVSNIYIQHGLTTFENLKKNMNTGIYITETMGMHNADSISGEFSVGVNGFFIENGDIKFPVHGITIAGNILDLFSNIVEAGSDLRFYGSVGSPSLLISKVAVAGE
ncbi:MAG: TldD/PmbA family protein [Elusimicrobia bacterium]|nr:TldD/PmbA family protein [Elusimicrobiota bacterium]